MPSPRSIACRQRAVSRLARRRLLLESLEQRHLLATFTVNSFLDTVDADLFDGVAQDSEGRTTLRAAVMQANSTVGNDTIVVPAGTIALTLANPVGFPIEDGSMAGDLDAYSGQITIQGAGQGETILDASALGDRVFETHGTAGFSLFDLTITGGTALQSSPLGGTMINRGRSTLTNVEILDSYAFGVGGAILNQTVTGLPVATLTISNSTFVGNVSDQGGGAITNFSGSLSIFNSTFRDNVGLLDGGAIVTQFGSFSVQGSIFENNAVDATNSGGGAISSRTFNALVEANTFQGNEAYTGGAIQAFDRMLIRRNTFVENQSVTHGGALLLPSAAVNLAHDVSNNTFSGNLAGQSGGAIRTQAWSTFLNNTVTANVASGGVGGVDNEFGHSSTRFQNNLIAGNFAEFPTALVTSDAAGTLTSLGGNLIGDATGVGGLGGIGDQAGTSAAPINPLLGPLADNGGPTRTHALLAGSPAIDRGRNTTALTIDQRGQPRPFNGVFDIGAFESQGENNAPVAASQTITLVEDTFKSGTLTATDADGDPLVYTIVGQPSHGALVQFNTATGAFVYRPAFDYSGPDSFTFRASDGSANSNLATVTIEVSPVNDAPRPIPIVADVTTNEDTPIGGQLAAFDPEGHAFTFSTPPQFAPQHGTVSLLANGAWMYTPAAGYYGTDIFGYYVTDELGAAEVGAVEITIIPVNDGPQAADDAYAILEDETLVVGALPVSRLQMVSQPGDYIGQGLTWEFDTSSAVF
ncbi:MAG: Ig-like domain-containing protein, partial [Pirellulaceae bacterium]|nr:Ig-like domain-containing protein [Pirellulaceae bacterium]